MSRRFECDYVRTSTAIGTIESIGVEWTEQASWRYSHRLTALVMAPIGVVWFTVVGAFASSINQGITLLALSIAATCVWFGVTYTVGALPRRSVIFEADGTILVPHGLPRRRRTKVLGQLHSEIASIEQGASVSGMAHDWTKSISLITEDGSTITVGERLHDDESLQVVRKLNLALLQLREQLAG